MPQKAERHQGLPAHLARKALWVQGKALYSALPMVLVRLTTGIVWVARAKALLRAPCSERQDRRCFKRWDGLATPYTPTLPFAPVLGPPLAPSPGTLKVRQTRTVNETR